MSNLVLVGLNHRTAGLDTRERAAFHSGKLPESLRALVSRPSIREAMIISTCNRVELLSVAENASEGRESLEEFLCETSGITRHELVETVYRYVEDDAVRHIFRVASSLDSMILGEAQILGQIKSFYQAAVDAGTVGAYLNGLLQAAFHAAKRVRTETNIGDYAVSVSSAAVELARKVFGNLRTATVLIVGAGKMGELAARQLRGTGVGFVRVANRNPLTAQRLALKFQAQVVPFDTLNHWIARSDIVITSTGSQEILVDYALAHSVMAARKTPIVFIDISVPRNVDPKVGAIENAFYYDVDDLGAVVEANLQERRKEASLGEKIVEQEVETFRARLRSSDIAPMVVQLQGRIQEICQAELQRYVRKAGPLNAEEKQELELMVSRIASKIAHPLISQMRSNSDSSVHQSAYLETIKRIFKLQKTTES